jgi:hypothetical protein
MVVLQVLTPCASIDKHRHCVQNLQSVRPLVTCPREGTGTVQKAQLLVHDDLQLKNWSASQGFETLPLWQ